jgi:hypothetical protein
MRLVPVSSAGLLPARCRRRETSSGDVVLSASARHANTGLVLRVVQGGCVWNRAIASGPESADSIALRCAERDPEECRAALGR